MLVNGTVGLATDVDSVMDGTEAVLVVPDGAVAELDAAWGTARTLCASHKAATTHARIVFIVVSGGIKASKVEKSPHTPHPTFIRRPFPASRSSYPVGSRARLHLIEIQQPFLPLLMVVPSRSFKKVDRVGNDVGTLGFRVCLGRMTTAAGIKMAYSPA